VHGTFLGVKIAANSNVAAQEICPGFEENLVARRRCRRRHARLGEQWFSIDSSVRITLVDRDVPNYFRSLEHLSRYCARPPFALERLSVIRGPDGRIARVRYVLPRHFGRQLGRPCMANNPAGTKLGAALNGQRTRTGSGAV